MNGKLYIVSTPIGNLEDITYRAIRILNECEYILAESSERTSKLLLEYKISKKIVTFNKDNEKHKSESIIDDLNNGATIALVSDAGTPSISDPGFELIKSDNKKFSILPIPGVSSVTCALAISKIPINTFSFFGFLPKKGIELDNSLKKIKLSDLPAVIFESKNRLTKLLERMKNILGPNVKINIFREMTKIHEEFICTSINEALGFYKDKKISGEFTLIVDRCYENNDNIGKYDEIINILLEKFSPPEVAGLISKFTGIRKKDIYKYLLNIRQER